MISKYFCAPLFNAILQRVIYVWTVVDIDDLVDMMRKQDDCVEKAVCNYDMTGSKIHHAKFSVRDTLEARELASIANDR